MYYGLSTASEVFLIFTTQLYQYAAYFLRVVKPGVAIIGIYHFHNIDNNIDFIPFGRPSVQMRNLFVRLTGAHDPKLCAQKFPNALLNV